MAVDVETSDTIGVYQRLPEEQIHAPRNGSGIGQRIRGDVLYPAGDMNYPFVLMFVGLVALVDDATGEGGSCGRIGAVGSSTRWAW
ncbi:MAG: hypothetical protein ACXWAY_18670 [Acidimicrobiia bacterium]